MSLKNGWLKKSMKPASEVPGTPEHEIARLEQSLVDAHRGFEAMEVNYLRVGDRSSHE